MTSAAQRPPRPWPSPGTVDVWLLPAAAPAAPEADATPPRPTRSAPGASTGPTPADDARPAPDDAARFDDDALLSPGERERAATFVRPADRVLYVRAHAGLRRAVAPYVGVAPERLVVGAGPCPLCGGDHGPPTLPHAPGLHLSLSHADGLAVVAVATDPVGVDVEPRDRPAGELEPLLPELHAEERALVAAADDPHAALLRCWVRKEALLKGLGVGLAEPLDRRSAAADVTADGWHLVDLDAGPGHVAALALSRPAGSGAPTVHRARTGGDPRREVSGTSHAG